jgi:hypothetical protein
MYDSKLNRTSLPSTNIFAVITSLRTELYPPQLPPHTKSSTCRPKRKRRLPKKQPRRPPKRQPRRRAMMSPRLSSTPTQRTLLECRQLAGLHRINDAVEVAGGSRYVQPLNFWATPNTDSGVTMVQLKMHSGTYGYVNWPLSFLLQGIPYYRKAHHSFTQYHSFAPCPAKRCD